MFSISMYFTDRHRRSLDSNNINVTGSWSERREDKLRGTPSEGRTKDGSETGQGLSSVGVKSVQKE